MRPQCQGQTQLLAPKPVLLKAKLSFQIAGLGGEALEKPGVNSQHLQGLPRNRTLSNFIRLVKAWAVFSLSISAIALLSHYEFFELCLAY